MADAMDKDDDDSMKIWRKKAKIVSDDAGTQVDAAKSLKKRCQGLLDSQQAAPADV